MSQIHLETQVGMHGDPRLFLTIRDGDYKVIANVVLTGNDVLRLASGGSVTCDTERPIRATAS